MEDKFMKTIDLIKEEMILLSESIFEKPELGFKEVNTNKAICEILEKYNVTYKNDVAMTGIVATLDSKKEGAHIGLLCELDAVPTINHQFSNPLDNAAHTCGHYAQVGTILGVFLGLKESNILENLGGKISFIATPAEEYCDFEYRNNLVKNKKLTYISGKQEMIKLGVFNDVDLIISCHTMGTGTNYYAETNSTLNGFLGKRITFKGKSAHAGANPSEGINALNAATLAMSGINFLRETFKEEDAIRVHYVMTQGGTTVNSVPEQTMLDMYIRAKTLDTILEVNKKVDRAIRGGALSIGCDVEICDTGGYLPLVQDKNLNSVIENNLLKFMDEDRILKNCHSFASGDIGDLSHLVPTIQVGVAGFDGNIHGFNFKTEDTKLAYEMPMKYLGTSVIELLSNNGEVAKNIKSKFESKFTTSEYIDLLNNLNKNKYYNLEDENV